MRLQLTYTVYSWHRCHGNWFRLDTVVFMLLLVSGLAKMKKKVRCTRAHPF